MAPTSKTRIFTYCVPPKFVISKTIFKKYREFFSRPSDARTMLACRQVADVTRDMPIARFLRGEVSTSE